MLNTSYRKYKYTLLFLYINNFILFRCYSFERIEENKIKTLKVGDSFGELALLDNRPRSATIICDEDSYFAVLEKQLFDKILS